MQTPAAAGRKGVARLLAATGSLHSRSINDIASNIVKLDASRNACMRLPVRAVYMHTQISMQQTAD
jgi:hypothetical protein